MNIGLTVNPTIDQSVEITGQPVSRTQASDASGRLPRYEAKCVQRTRSNGESVPLRADIKGTELPLSIIQAYIDTTRKAIDCATTLPLTVLYNETLQQTSRPLLSKLYERR